MVQVVRVGWTEPLEPGPRRPGSLRPQLVPPVRENSIDSVSALAVFASPIRGIKSGYGGMCLHFVVPFIQIGEQAAPSPPLQPNNMALGGTMECPMKGFSRSIAVMRALHWFLNLSVWKSFSSLKITILPPNSLLSLISSFCSLPLLCAEAVQAKLALHRHLHGRLDYVEAASLASSMRAFAALAASLAATEPARLEGLLPLTSYAFWALKTVWAWTSNAGSSGCLSSLQLRCMQQWWHTAFFSCCSECELREVEEIWSPSFQALFSHEQVSQWRFCLSSVRWCCQACVGHAPFSAEITCESCITHFWALPTLRSFFAHFAEYPGLGISDSMGSNCCSCRTETFLSWMLGQFRWLRHWDRRLCGYVWSATAHFDGTALRIHDHRRIHTWERDFSPSREVKMAQVSFHPLSAAPQKGDWGKNPDLLCLPNCMVRVSLLSSVPPSVPNTGFGTPAH